eukprot:581435-Rhodomonas_salina.2
MKVIKRRVYEGDRRRAWEGDWKWEEDGDEEERGRKERGREERSAAAAREGAPSTATPHAPHHTFLHQNAGEYLILQCA